jgi:hypothetical protein
MFIKLLWIVVEISHSARGFIKDVLGEMYVSDERFKARYDKIAPQLHRISA